MERGVGAFGYGIGNGNLVCNKSCVYNYKPKPSPPLSAIDMFLWGQNHSTTSHHHQQYSTQSTASIGGCISWQSNQLKGDSFNIDDGEISLALTEDDKNPNIEIVKEVMKAPMKKISFSKGMIGKRNKKTLIKGQWTDDEDRKLIRLVKQYGVRKWTQIAESLVGRIGKQCRERWNNHLRPDIKKKFKKLCVNVESSQEIGLGSSEKPTIDMEIVEDELFLTSSSGKKKSRVYSLGNVEPQFYSESSYSVTSTPTKPSLEVQELLAKFEEERRLAKEREAQAAEREKAMKDQLLMIMEQVRQLQQAQQQARLPPHLGSRSQ